jgi:ketosteroid isomerase-like protein
MFIRSAVVFIVAALVIMTGCGNSASNNASNRGSNSNSNAVNSAVKPAATPDRATDEAALRAADLAWSEAAGKKDVEAVVGFMTDDGSTLPPNEPIQNNKEAIKKGWTALLGLKDLTIAWTPTIVQVADSGETGYTSGTWSMTFTDPKGVKMSDKGKYVEVWKKVDGKWKCHLDAYNSDLATPVVQ